MTERSNSRTGPLMIRCDRCGAEPGELCHTLRIWWHGKPVDPPEKKGCRPHSERFKAYEVAT